MLWADRSRVESESVGTARWDAGIRAGVISAVAAVLALIVALLAWLWPQQPGDEDKSAPAASGATSPTPAAPTTAKPAGAVFLNSTAFPPESGAADLVPVPRAIRGKAGWTGNEIAIRCPTNQTGDQTSEVTYLLRGRYAQFDVTVHPYYPDGADQQAVTYVTAVAAVRTSDGGLDTTVAGTQKTATYATAADLSAPVDGAEKLTVRVECADPNGTVVLTGARLTPA